MKRYVLLVQVLIVAVLLVGCDRNKIVTDLHPPTITGSTSTQVGVGGTLPDWKSFVVVYDEEDGQIVITNDMINDSDFDINTIGSYKIVYTVLDSDGMTSTHILWANVVATETVQYANGAYDLSTLDGESKAMIYNAMEDYLLENVIGGVPLHRNGTYYMYSERMNLYSDVYNNVFTFGERFSSLSSDDSTVLMNANTYGNTGEFTFRIAYQFELSQYNPYEDEYNDLQGILSYSNSSLYRYDFDSSMSGVDIVPELAAGVPYAVGGETVNNEVVSTIWRIPVQDNLTWTFHPNTDTSGFDSGYDVLDASDFVWTWQTALEEEWFRAVSGGYDFVSMSIKGAKEYIDGTTTDMNDVGIRLANDENNTIEIEFTKTMSEMDVLLMFMNISSSPINQELYDSLQAKGMEYGSTPENTASSGPYYLYSVDQDKTIQLRKCIDYFDQGTYHYTGIQFRFIADENDILSAFLAGELDVAEVPQSEVTHYYDDPRSVVAPSYVTWRLVINAFQSIAERDAYFGTDSAGADTIWEPKPILQYTEMKQALYYSVDRENSGSTYLPAYTYYANNYIVDFDGTAIYSTPSGAALLEKYREVENRLTVASDLFHTALEKALDDGYYKDEVDNATTENPYLIPLELTYSSDTNQLFNDYMSSLESRLETSLFDEEHHVGIDIVLHPVAFPDNYYDYITIANTDLGIGALSGMSENYDLNQYRDDNHENPLNFGIDTSTANIDISYYDYAGELRVERWSFNAMCEALQGLTYVDQGVVQTSWESKMGVIDAYNNLYGLSMTSLEEDTTVAPSLFDQTLFEKARDLGYDSLSSFIVHYDDGSSLLFVLLEQGGQYEIYNCIQLYDSVEDAIRDKTSYFSSDLVSISDTPLTDQEVQTNSYLQATYDYSSVSDIALDKGVSLEHTELYAIEWTTWSDVYLIIHVDGYYIAWYWL